MVNSSCRAQASGVYIKYCPNGTRKSHAEYKNGKIHGKYITWYDDVDYEIIKEECSYKENKKDEKYIRYENIEFYDIDNKKRCISIKREESQYNNGKKHGKSIIYESPHVYRIKEGDIVKHQEAINELLNWEKEDYVLYYNHGAIVTKSTCCIL
ncbi:MORN-repeat protein [Orpheovirus IHUMI-LCC2]|uniref:MORN-repeat protein n=1 Tax=Orpheovirus IHUMI-LCC2 TaxID=2023057 RepID=A0A2I2L533_9VIRU|nr:MORN-repeat protein [Orpheovirus IHUMI-LCC2]SNW62665.1 MORN-repeat protein [Orpheovirus IHUMI-LCC2]